MKHDTSTRYLLLLCGCLLLPLSSAFAQPPQRQDLQGIYTLDDSAASDAINKKIEAAAKEISFLFRARVRSELKKTNLPPPQRITISYTPADVSITTDRSGLIQTPSNGSPIDWISNGEKFQVSTKWENGTLERTFKGKKGQRVNNYTISADGKTLTVEVSLTSSWLKQPLTYKLVYKRTAQQVKSKP